MQRHSSCFLERHCTGASGSYAPRTARNASFNIQIAFCSVKYTIAKLRRDAGARTSSLGKLGCADAMSLEGWISVWRKICPPVMHSCSLWNRPSQLFAKPGASMALSLISYRYDDSVLKTSWSIDRGTQVKPLLIELPIVGQANVGDTRRPLKPETEREDHRA